MDFERIDLIRIDLDSLSYLTQQHSSISRKCNEGSNGSRDSLRFLLDIKGAEDEDDLPET